MPSTRSAAPRPLSLLASVASSEEAQVLHLAARRAEDEGDFAGASRLVGQLPDDRLSRRWQCELDAARRIDPENRAGLACWLIFPALRWAAERPAGAVLDRYAVLMLRTLRTQAGDRQRRVPLVARYDPAVVDAGLFDAGLFNGYLAQLGSTALDAFPGLRKWSAQLVLVWEVLRIVDGGVELKDLFGGGLRHVRHWPDASPQTYVYGRLVPVAGEIALSFPLTPVTVDQRCAARLVRARRQGGGPEERLRAVAHSRRRAALTGGPDA